MHNDATRENGPSPHGPWDEPTDGPAAPGPNGTEPDPRGRTTLAWLVIIGICLFVLVVTTMDGPEPEAADGPGVETMLMEIQAKYLLGISEMPGARQQALSAVKQQFADGSLDQRMRVIILLADLDGAELAAERLRELEALLRERMEREESPLELREDQQRTLESLRALYANVEGEAPRVDRLDAAQRDALRDDLGWFGELALAHRAVASDAERRPVTASARRVSFVFLGAVVFFGLLALSGGIGLVLLIIMIARGTVRSLLAPSRTHHGIYAETFAVWLALFLALQISAMVVRDVAPELGYMYIFVVVFFGSLVALAWPVWRGVPWSQVRQDLGLTLGRRPLVELVSGAAGYAMALPLVAVGLVIMLILMEIHSLLFGANSDPLMPQGVPAHPVAGEMAAVGWFVKLQLLLVGAVAAPVVEEIMFRGALYRHLRDASRAAGVILSVVLAAGISSFVFAAVHPQGWTAIPLLMSLAIAFSIARECRGSIVAPVVMHAISNGIILSMIIVLTSL